MTSQLLAYAGQGRFIVGEVKIRDVIEDQIQRMRTGIPENIRLTLDLADDLPVILADPNQLRHMIQGLMNNAIEAIGSRPGGLIEIAARLEHVDSNALVSPGAEPLPQAHTASSRCVTMAPVWMPIPWRTPSIRFSARNFPAADWAWQPLRAWCAHRTERFA